MTDMVRAIRTIIFRRWIGDFKYDVLGLALRTDDRVVDFSLFENFIVPLPQVRGVFVEQP
jgi:hypothetical protein